MVHAPVTVPIVCGDAGEVPLERIEDEITALAGHINAATCRYLLLVAEFDAREGWAGWGTKSCAHWLGWRCGISPEAAREQVRVARGVPELARMTEAFGRGELSYSKVRALTRIATRDTEETLLMWARHSTGAQTETFVRLYRRCRQTVGTREGERRHARRYLHHRYDDDGMLVIEARLCPEDGAVLLRALELAVESLGQAGAISEHEGVSAETPGAVRFQRVFPRKRRGAVRFQGREGVPAETSGARFGFRTGGCLCGNIGGRFGFGTGGCLRGNTCGRWGGAAHGGGAEGGCARGTR